MLEIYFDNETKVDMSRWEDLYNNLFETAVNILDIKVENISLSITWIDKDRALTMNKEYRQKEYVPDVISFPLEMSKEEVEQTNYLELGDIFICYEVAKQKAEHYKHDIYTEMAFLFVHGFLHLMGYDHETNKADEKKMFAIQDKILKAEGINYEVIYDDQDYL